VSAIGSSGIAGELTVFQCTACNKEWSEVVPPRRGVVAEYSPMPPKAKE
jgi:hypothetical protein